MPRKSNRNKRRARKMVQRKGTNPSAQVLMYRGPVLTRADKEQVRTASIFLSQVITVVLNSSSICSQVVSLALNQFNNYGDFTPLWDEFRLLRADCEFVPLSQYALQNSSNGVLAMVIDRDSNGSLTTLSQAIDYESAVCKSYLSPNKITFEMSGAEDAGFASVSTFSSAYIKLYGGTGVASATLGYLLIRARFQFRGRLA